jgi:hypothetical protein
MVRHLLWGLKVDDLSYQGIPGGYPRFPAEALCLLKPMSPDSVMLQNVDFELRGVEEDLTWVFLDKDNPRRRRAMQFYLGDFQQKSCSIVKSLSLIISSGINQAIYKREPHSCAFQQLANVAQPPNASTLLRTDPFRFWREFIADLIGHFPSDLIAAFDQGDAASIAVITQRCWGDVAAHRFSHTLVRLLYCRLRSQCWINDMYRLVPGIRMLHDVSIATARQRLRLEYGSTELKKFTEFLQLGDDDKVFKVLNGHSLQLVLFDSIFLSRLIQSLVDSFSNPFIVPTHSHMMTVIQTLVLQVIILCKLNASGADKSLFVAGLEDFQTCCAYLKRTLNKTRNNIAVPVETQEVRILEGKDSWEKVLFDKLHLLDGVDQQWVGEFYSKTMQDIL